MNLDFINEYIFMKHNILPGTQQDCIADVARNHLGLHSARIMTPYTTLCSRINEYSPDMLTTQLYKDRNMIKLRCMRTTLHMIPFDLASVLHMSTLDIRLADCRLFFKRNNITVKSIQELKYVLEGYIDTPKPSNEIENRVLKEISFVDQDIRKECAKRILKYFWETGLLCYVNVANDWEKEERRYALTKYYYPEVNLEQYDIRTAQELLVFEYLNKFGPATIKDITWWSGLSINIIKEAIYKYKDSIIKFKADDCELEFYVSATEYDKLEKYHPIDSEWLTLLAYEDPSLKGYYESRFRYVSEENYNLLFNQIGEVRASIIYNGKAIGIWEWDKTKKCINLEYFKVPNKKIRNKVELTKEQYESMLYPNRQITLFDNSF